MTVFQNPKLLHRDPPLFPRVTHGSCQFSLPCGHVLFLIGTVLHNVRHGIQLLRDHIPVFLQTVVPRHVQMRLFKHKHDLFDHLILVRAILLQFLCTLIDICPALQCLQKAVQHLIHRCRIFFPTDCTLITGRTDSSGDLRLHPSKLLRGKIFLIAVHLPKRLR